MNAYAFLNYWGTCPGRAQGLRLYVWSRIHRYVVHYMMEVAATSDVAVSCFADPITANL